MEIQILQSKQGLFGGNKTHLLSSILEIFDCWTCHQSFCFLINRTDTFSPLKGLQLPRVINLLQLNYCTKHTPVSEGDFSDCGSTEKWICINSKWLIESSQRVMRICSKIMRRINHCRFTRHFGREHAFHACAGVEVKEKLAFSHVWIGFTFFKIKVTLINKKKLYF